jgi:hypothetical protein
MHSPDTAWITIRQWHSYARRIERRHLRQYGVSWSATTIAQRARACMVEIQTERIRVRTDWRRVMQQAAEDAYPCAAQGPPTPSPATILPPPRQ